MSRLKLFAPLRDELMGDRSQVGVMAMARVADDGSPWISLYRDDSGDSNQWCALYTVIAIPYFNGIEDRSLKA